MVSVPPKRRLKIPKSSALLPFVRIFRHIQVAFFKHARKDITFKYTTKNITYLSCELPANLEAKLKPRLCFFPLPCGRSRMSAVAGFNDSKVVHITIF